MADKRKTVLITGCSAGGIGHALATEFHSRGFRVFATARNMSKITDLSELGIETLSLTVDNSTSISAVKEDIEKRTGGTLDILINNAGQAYSKPALDLELDAVQQIFDVNVFAVMRMCQAFAPLLIKAKGAIVQIGSISALMPFVFGSAYSASKAALHNYTDALRVELRPFGVSVTNVISGGVISHIVDKPKELPEDSIYKPIETQWKSKNISQDGAMETSKYAKSVVGRLVKPNPPREIWEGTNSGLIKLLSGYFPKSLMDWYFKDLYGISSLSGGGNKKKE